MSKWFRSGLPPHQTALAMLGVKAGQTAVFLGAGDADLAAEIARITGLNGRTLLVDQGEPARRKVDAAAGRAGALVEFADAPVTSVADEGRDTFDLAAITMDRWSHLAADERRRCVGEAFRLVRPGGRIVIVLRAGKGGWLGKAKTVPRELADEALALLTAAGSRAVRVLGELPGTTYVEGVKPRPTAGT